MDPVKLRDWIGPHCNPTVRELGSKYGLVNVRCFCFVCNCRPNLPLEGETENEKKKKIGVASPRGRPLTDAMLADEPHQGSIIFLLPGQQSSPSRGGSPPHYISGHHRTLRGWVTPPRSMSWTHGGFHLLGQF